MCLDVAITCILYTIILYIANEVRDGENELDLEVDGQSFQQNE